MSGYNGTRKTGISRQMSSQNKIIAGESPTSEYSSSETYRPAYPYGGAALTVSSGADLLAMDGESGYAEKVEMDQFSGYSSPSPLTRRRTTTQRAGDLVRKQSRHLSMHITDEVESGMRHKQPKIS